jgi:hypothetical protein
MFLRREQQEWKPIQEAVFRERTMPDTIHLKWVTEKIQGTDSITPDKLPDVILLSSGEITPFELEIESDLIEDRFRISGTETGELHLDHVYED